jgi:hypothetical protein
VLISATADRGATRRAAGADPLIAAADDGDADGGAAAPDQLHTAIADRRAAIDAAGGHDLLAALLIVVPIAVPPETI